MDGRGVSLGETVRVGLPTDFPVREVAEYIFRPDVLGRWLGHGAVLPLAAGAAMLPVQTGAGSSWRQGSVVSAAGDLTKIVVAWTDGDGDVTFIVTPRPARTAVPRERRIERPSIRPQGRQLARRPEGSYVRIVETHLVGESAGFALRTWQRALNRLELMLEEAMRRRLKSRQAIVLVHGIGEQRPGQTLRQFVAAMFPSAHGKAVFVKPDYYSPLVEMRKATVPRDESTRLPTTDIYEMYWAHLVRGTTPAQVYGWLFRLLTAGKRVPKPLRKYVLGIWGALIIFAVLIAVLWSVGAFTWLGALFAVGILAVVPAIWWFILRYVQDSYVVKFAGDAARYLEPRPENIQLREDIRAAGLDLLADLHESGRYDRIILFGHSLGSVIAYDILSQAWVERSRERDEQVGRTSSRCLRAVEDLLNPRPGERGTSIDDIRRRQFAAWKENRRNGFSWLVSDLVTAGSPLAHARWLLELDGRTSFDDLVRERVLPTCPPQTEARRSASPGRDRRVFTFTHSYDDPLAGRTRSLDMPNHAAPFAITRWSNVYFPISGLLHGDPVGGPLQDSFGSWIDDIPLPHPGSPTFVHTAYLDAARSTAHVDLVRQALDLSFPTPLADLGSE